MATPSLISCRWDWCRSSFASIDALDTHVKHEHIWPMKPMRKADIALMRRMDLQSLHSSPNTDSSIISRGISFPPARSGFQTTMTSEVIVGVSRNKTPLTAPPTSTPGRRSANDVFDIFTQLSSPLQAHSPERLPASPALEGLIRQDGHSGLSAAVEMFERAHTHKGNQHLRLPPHQCSPTHRPLSDSSGSSQEVVEQQLTQEDHVGPQPLPPSELQIGSELVDVELRWPADDEPDVVASEETSNSEQPVTKQIHRPSISPDSARSRNFRYGSLSVPLDADSHSSSPLQALQGSHSQTQPIILQTQAPYSSQTTGWSQTQ